MSSSVAEFRFRRADEERLSLAGTRERVIERRVGIAWALLVLNSLTFYAGYSLFVPIPHRVGQVITQGALPAALLLALTVNRRIIVRPNMFLCLVSLLVIVTFVTTLQNHSPGTIYRTFRFAEFVGVLWLLSPWWGRRNMLLLRYYLLSLSVVLGSVLLGLLVYPGGALYEGRLTGALWPIPATEVAHYSAITIGLVVVLWLGGLLRGRVTLFVAAVVGTMLILTHTRTALIGVVAAVLVAGLSLFTARGRVRKFFAGAGVLVSLGIITAAGILTTWLARGQSGQQLADLTGRTKVWAMVLILPRNWFQEFFGLGISNAAINGLPIDGNWLTAYMQDGLFGVTVCGLILLFLFVAAFFQPTGVRRALALFLVTYSVIASITEVGFVDPSTYLLELTLAASLLVPAAGGRTAAVRCLCEPSHARVIQNTGAGV